MAERFLHPDKDDTPQDATKASRILTIALAKVTKEGWKTWVNLDGEYYLVTNEKDGMIHVYPGTNYGKRKKSED